MTLNQSGRVRLREMASDLLRRNDRGGSTIPSPRLYPHIWNWDSAFAALGWSYLDPGRALLELERLLAAAWPEGLVPHIVFNPEATGYEPGPRWWRTAGAPQVGAALTSSITQPPVAATALRQVLAAGGPELLARGAALLRPLEAWHRWFFSHRDPLGEGLPVIIHPWESGMDNSPRWDAPLQAVPERESLGFERADTSRVSPEERPRESDYLRYAHLVELNADHSFAPPHPGQWPFLVQDVVLLAILLEAEEDLQALCSEQKVPSQAGQRARRLRQAIESNLFDPGSGRFHDRDLGGSTCARDTIAAHLPIYAGLGGRAAAEAAAAAIAPGGALWASPGPPTVAPSSPGFEPRRYWRGPIWINVCWMLHRGLRRAGLGEAAEDLARRTLALVESSGFREYYDPTSGEGLGATDFTWSAALVLDLLAGPAAGSDGA